MTWDEEWTATSIAAAVASGATDPREVVGEALRRIAHSDEGIGAFQEVCADEALAEAADLRDRLADRQERPLPMAGVPIAVKDNIPVAGLPMRNGTLMSSPVHQAVDHPVVRRLRDAGAIVVGVTRVPELCVFATTDSAFGLTRNPWQPTTSPGGSSGGSAAAVASGMVPVAHGADGMGSIRIPAACTGLVGIKPGLGVVPAHMGATDWYGMSENGVLATTVADAALVLSVMADRPEWADAPEPAGRLRVALSFRPPVAGVRLDPAHAAAAGRAATALTLEGHGVTREEIRYPNAAAVGALSRWFAGAAGDAVGIDPRALEPRVRTHARLGSAVARSPLMSERLRTSWQRAATEFLDRYDVLVTPALAQPPIEAKAWSAESWASNMRANMGYAPYAAPWNLAGFPAIVVPMGIHPRTGTPVAVQIVGRPGTEPLLLGVARALERRLPWQRVAPRYATG